MYRNEIKKKAVPYVRRRRNRRIWGKIVQVMACFVVFCTTYALILPAITAQQEYFCGKDVHEHGEDCYVQESVTEFLCMTEEQLLHVHDELCYDAEEQLICPLPELEEHLHSESCYEVAVIGHSHGENCYDGEGTLICTEEEKEEVLELTCPKEERQLHSHDESCLDDESTLICELEELGEHQHSEDCVAQITSEPQLICELEEHVHVETCRIDTEADVETAEIWESTLSHVELSGDWSDDLLAIAKSQIGYMESEQNYIVDTTEQKKGYTRYGQWYGIPYGDWDAMFVSFCLDYAQIPIEAIPQDSNVQGWFDTLQKLGLIHDQSVKLPVVGDIAFLADENGEASGIAIVSEVETAVDAETETVLRLQIIQGDYENQVAQRNIDLNEVPVLAYCSVDAEPIAAVPTEPIVQSVETENYIVTVSYPGDFILPEGAQLKVTEYAKDSEIFRQRCQEVGYELEWLLNIGFFVGEEELDLNGAFDVVVTSKQGIQLDKEITHFTEEGAERIDGETVTETAGENQTAVAFSAASFSDFGGAAVRAVAPLAAGNRPAAVTTGNVHVNRLRFYNICDSGSDHVTALAGCEFLIEGKTNGYSATVTSGNEAELDLPSDIPDGTYTITEISVPEGYMRDTNYQREFEIEDHMLVSNHNIGTFVNHSMERLEAGKTAEVEDYNNRIYQVLLDAKSNMEMVQVGPVDILFVVDQSNSMLFPSGLKSTGRSVVLNKNGYWNTNRMDNLVRYQGLDRNQLYYVIADPEGTATVWAIWYDYQHNTWLCQDASYYAKAYHNNANGYYTPGEEAIFPSNYSYTEQKESIDGEGKRSNGCGLSKNLQGGSLGNYINNSGSDEMTFELYTATDEYNRMHYLEEAMTNMIYELADANPLNRVTLIGFTREIKIDKGPLELTTDNVTALVDAVTSINTAGGTRQDVALKETYNRHLGPDASYKNNTTYTILVTDGAPVKATQVDNRNVGQYTDPPSNSNDASIYSQIKYHAQRVRNESVLMTVGLGLESVKGGGEVLKAIASDQNYYCAMEDAAQMVHNMQKLLFESFNSVGRIEIRGDIVDEISDSFYPIAWVNRGAGASTGRRVLLQDSTRDWILLQDGDYITLDGKYSAGKAAGQLKLIDGTYTMQWTGAAEAEKPLISGDNPWRGTFYVKAKEDFIGGNAIETNKSAKVTVHGSDKILDEPTVNVRLLGMNEMSSEETVYLGDWIGSPGNQPIEVLKDFYADTRFSKLISDGGSVLNKMDAGSNGLEEDHFSLRYAIGRDLTQDEWTRLVNGQVITVEYTYDNPSSNGAVGYFTFRLEKKGIDSASPDYAAHETTAACQPMGVPDSESCGTAAESYLLHISYTAHRLGLGGRPANNVFNGSGSPGTQVGDGSTLESGLGVIEKKNQHDVHVISGAIEITKRFADGLTDPADRSFTFILHRIEDGEDTSRDVTKSITIPANSQTGAASIIFDKLRRGTYTVTEAVDSDYMVKEIQILDTTNCFSTPAIGESAAEISFTMGNNVSNTDVIGKTLAEDRFSSYIDPTNGVYGAAEFTNKVIVYEGTVPVEKVWDDDLSTHTADTVYLLLYKDEQPVLDADGNAKILKIDESTGWKGSFTVVLASKEDQVSNYQYSVREISQISAEELHGWNKAVLENDGTTMLYYETALNSGELVGINGKGYMVRYEKNSDGVLIVKNNQAMALPSTGGQGTTQYTFGGLLLLGTACLMYYKKRGKEGRGK